MNNEPEFEEVDLYFRKAEILPLLDHCLTAPSQRNYFGEILRPSLILTADRGIYLFSSGEPCLLHDGSLGQGSKEKPLMVAYALDCDVRTDPHKIWWPIHQKMFGGSDGSEPIEAKFVERAVNDSDELVLIGMKADRMEIIGDREARYRPRPESSVN